MESVVNYQERIRELEEEIAYLKKDIGLVRSAVETILFDVKFGHYGADVKTKAIFRGVEKDLEHVVKKLGVISGD